LPFYYFLLILAATRFLPSLSGCLFFFTEKRPCLHDVCNVYCVVHATAAAFTYVILLPLSHAYSHFLCLLSVFPGGTYKTPAVYCTFWPRWVSCCLDRRAVVNFSSSFHYKGHSALVLLLLNDSRFARSYVTGAHYVAARQ
jgi:hypothetical protein